MRKEFLVFGQPRIGQDEIDEWMDSIRKGWIGAGEKVARFEKDFASFKKVPNAAAVSSCTAALHLSCLALGIKAGDEVITSAMTFCATVNAIIHTGATPVLADIDPETLNIDPVETEKKITSRTKAIIVVHFAGRPCEMDEIMNIAARHKLFVIEDCAHAIEAEYKEMPCGTIGDIGCFSFYATKNITTGEGGMVLTRSEDILAKIKQLACHGLSSDAWKRHGDKGFLHYFAESAGFKYNMTDLQAAFGIHQLKRIQPLWEKRKQIWERYLSSLQGLPVILPAAIPGDSKHAFHLFTLRIDRSRCGITRDEFLQRMHSFNIGCGVHYQAIPCHPYYRDTYHFAERDYPCAVDYGKQTVSIPLSPWLTEEDVSDVTEAMKQALE